MEYFIGSISTLIVLFVAYKVFDRVPNYHSVKLTRSQSFNYELIKPAIPLLGMFAREQVMTQSRKHNTRNHVKVVMVDNQAYWIENNSFYVADMNDEGIDSDTIKVVDTMSMNDVELDKIMFIVEKLNEGKSNDSRNPGNSQL